MDQFRPLAPDRACLPPRSRSSSRATAAGRAGPSGPADRCLNWRWNSNGSLHRWEFEKDGEELEVAVGGPLIVNDTELFLRGALDGVGIAYLFDEHVRPWIKAGKLKRVLTEWARGSRASTCTTRVAARRRPR